MKLRVGQPQDRPRWQKILRTIGLVLVSVLLILAADAAVRVHRAADGIPVLNYHQINNQDVNSLTVRTDQFEAQMKYLADNGYHAITPEDLVDAWENGTELPDKPVIITFDDGYIDNYKNAYPILQKYNLKATIFLISDFIGTYPNYMTWDEALEMQQSGLIDFEGHTLSHPELSKLSDEDLKHQLEDSKAAIEYRLQKKVSFLAYPCGDYTQRVQNAAKDAGYRAAFTVHLGYAEKDAPRYKLDRVPIFGDNTHTFERFKYRMKFAPAWVPYDDLKKTVTQSDYSFFARFIVSP